MRVGELAVRAGVTIRALRYYEAAGLVVPTRLANGYRDYDPRSVRLVAEIRALTGLGLSVEETRPFVECLASGHGASDECPASLAAYRQVIDQLSERIASLTRRRDTLAAHLESAANRAVAPATAVELTEFPAPADDGAADHLAGTAMPGVRLPTTGGTTIRLDELGAGRTVLYVYPLSGRPGVDLPEGWTSIPGASGCTPQACGFRDHYDDLRAAGAERVYGVSSQPSDYQRELVDRLRLPFAMVSDEAFGLRDALRLPTFEAGGLTLYRRLTLIVKDGIIEKVFYPVFPPGRHAAEVLDWLEERR
ncbi:redoxin family protein [Nonomuraea sp. MCN248]|uniref:Redoxin family protein n=1 Tax=Nonomuraea corallina TaxID=2989783 RepID=A0ABT4SC22_9ACTN|nr:MerR family transcriptional regulator [Nonomuraea corallina]MDA0634530.1 redoxin family protein [Nonomuraea corallina]